MDEAKRQQVREGILEDLYEVARDGFPAVTLMHGLTRIRRIKISEEELDRELNYLEGKGFIERRASAISVASVRWVITAAGQEYLEAEGLV